MTQHTDVPRLIRTVLAGIIILGLFASWLGMEWTGREPDSLILLGAVAIALGAAYYLWDDAMGEGVAAVGDLQGNDSDDGGESGG
ncbi:hypothetical protein [Halorussus marinus]|uniref:hypothetical protein n=1 Tax=Halorussus marinus TaxID=2505976 RepID=UPI001091E718|nr:hypothetical protein [Halorussus marinus]